MKVPAIPLLQPSSVCWTNKAANHDHHFAVVD
jgi:hypothetical protein